MAEQDFDKKAVVALLNEILETELAGVVRYTHYSLMIFGHNRIPIVSWLRGEANVCLAHANEAGELVTHLGEHPSLKIGALLESKQHSVQDILLESLEAGEDRSGPLQTFARCRARPFRLHRRVRAQNDRRRRNAHGRSQQDAAQAGRDPPVQAGINFPHAETRTDC